MTHPRRSILVIVGPTAGGKTDLSISLARHLPGGGEVISADSMLVYRGMNIGTAKPALADRRGIPHHLIDIVEADESFTVDQWLARCGRIIEEVRDRERWPIVVGGTNLYVKVLMEGMFKGPPADESLRARLALIPTTDLHAELLRVDPMAASRLHPNDRKRLTRALEVFELTGRPISELQTQWDSASRSIQRDDVILIGLDWPPGEINRRINERVKRMMEAGLLEEVSDLVKSGRMGRQAAEALGYKQLICFLEGRCTHEDAVEQIKIESRRFARKQRTWLKRFRSHRPSIWLDMSRMNLQDAVGKVLEFVNGQMREGR